VAPLGDANPDSASVDNRGWRAWWAALRHIGSSRRARWIALIYALFAMLWIYFSDHLLNMLVSDPALLLRWSIYKGLAYVLVTSILLLFLMQRAFGAVETAYAALRAHQEQLVRNAQQLSDIISSASDAIVSLDGSGRVVLFNSAAEAMFGWPAEKILGNDVKQCLPEFDWREAAPRSSTLQIDGVRRDGRHIVLEGSVSHLGSGNSPMRTLILRNISDQLAHVHEVERLQRLLDALSHINQAIVRLPIREELFSRICRILVENGGFRMAWIGCPDSVSGLLRPVAQFGDTRSYLSDISISFSDVPEGRGPTGTAFRTGRPYICNDIENDPVTLAWRHKATQRGYRALAALPIRRKGEVHGVLSVYADESLFFQDREIALLSEAAVDISFALDNLAREAERHEADARAASEQRFSEAMIDSMPGVVYFYDMRGRFLRWNRNFEQVSGYPAAAIATMHPSEFFAPEDRPALEQRITEVFISGESALDASFLARDGSSTPYFFTGKRVMFEGITCLVGIGIDMTEQRAVEHQLRQACDELQQERVRLAAAQSVAKVGSWETDLATGIVTWSDETRRIFECSPDEHLLSHQLFLQFVHPQDRASVDAAFADSLTSHGENVHEHRIVVPDGRIKLVEERWRIITDTAGRAVRALGTCQDITERHNLEEGLRQTQRLEAIGQLTGGVAHDFNNLLTVILGNAELLVEQLAGSPLSRVAELVVAAAQRGDDLTKRLLVFARKQVLEPRSTDVAAVIDGLVALLRPTLAVGIEIELEAAPGLWHAWVDGAQLEHALLNLCFNARDAMPEGGRLKISLANVVCTAPQTSAALDSSPVQDLAPGDYVALSVSDTGSGIAKEHLAHVFEPFFTTKEKGKGTGLGLSMVYGFALQSEGHVSIESAPGEGTRVWLHLPRAMQPTDADKTQVRDAEVPGGDEAILLVEDDELVRSFASAQLRALGYRVTEADSGAHALQLLAREDSFDLLFTDMAMPGMNGSQLAVSARALRPALRVLFTSGYASQALAGGSATPVAAMPDAELLRKPYRRIDLARKLRAVLDS